MCVECVEIFKVVLEEWFVCFEIEGCLVFMMKKMRWFVEMVFLLLGLWLIV